MAVFRVEKNSGYTVMSNHHLRNRALSLKAKGLLSQMLSLPEDWDYTLQGLARINRESIDAIRQAIRELEQAGYIQRSRERDEKGRLRGADYVIFELPQPVSASVSPTLENPTLENPTQENPTLENPMQLNKDKLITEKQKKEGLNTDSIPNQGQYNLPEPPKLADFDQSLQDYKAQVQAEIEQEAAAAGMTVKEYAAAGFEAPQQDSFSIYQLRNEDSTPDYRFEPYDRLQAAGLTVDKANYTEVYAAPLTAGTTLEDIYRTFNVDYPADFKGHSLSVSDVVVLHQNGQDTAHYCDSVGFQQVPEFLRENPLRTAELSTEQNENMIDGVLNNAPSLGELEAKVKAGEQISLTDLAAAVKAEEKAPKAKKSRTAKPKKPSIRAQLDAAKKEQSKQTPPREKTKELEV